MLTGLKRWIRNAARQVDEQDKLAVWAGDQKPRTTAEDVVRMGSSSMATIYRIDNGFLVFINMNSEAHLGARGTLVYAKDAHEVAEKIVANEAAFKMGLREYSNGSRPVPTPANAFLAVPHSRKLLNELSEYSKLKGTWKDV